MLKAAQERGIMTCVATDLLSLVLLKEPGAMARRRGENDRKSAVKFLRMCVLITVVLTALTSVAFLFVWDLLWIWQVQKRKPIKWR